MPFDQQMDVIYNAWYHGLSKTPFTQLANLAGEPALSLPTYVNAQGLPLGIQLEGEKGSDLILLALGKLFEEKGKLIFLSNYQKLDNAAQSSEPQNEDAASISKVVVHNLGEKAVYEFQTSKLIFLSNYQKLDNAAQSSEPQNEDAASISKVVVHNLGEKAVYEFQTIPSKLNFSDNVSPKYAVRTSKQVNARKLQSTKEKQLPQTGSNNNDGLVLLGLALFPLSLTSVYQNKRKF